jgi:hypothetical protein
MRVCELLVGEVFYTVFIWLHNDTSYLVMLFILSFLFVDFVLLLDSL